MLKEIVTKTVISKGKIVDNKEYSFAINEDVSKAIGCWIINHNFVSLVENNKTYVNGRYDVHIWYAINGSSDTRLYKQTVEYKEEIILENNNFDKDASEYKIYCIEYPTCTNLKYVDNVFVINVKKGLALDVVGESKLLINVSDSWGQEDNNLGINPNYLNK